jgi:HSP20 family molecular chaperone IbpA
LCRFGRRTQLVWWLSNQGEGEKHMEKNHYFDLLTSVDVMNTLNGGRVEPTVRLSQLENSREIRVRIPGIDAETIDVDVNNNTVAIYYTLNIVSGEKLMKIPYTVYNRQQPYFIDVSKINAQTEKGELIVNLPFNKLANGYHKKLRTRED